MSSQLSPAATTASAPAVTPAASAGLQCKLEIGDVDDPLEFEADAMADRVMRMPEPNFIQRKCAHCEEEEKLQRKPITPFIMRKAGSSVPVAAGDLSARLNATQSSGNTMDNTTRNFMESRFAADFSNIRVHADSESASMNRDINARAFTSGRDIYFNEAQYAPHTSEGKHLLAHELTHTLQQGSASRPENAVIRRDFSPWPEQIGADVAGTRTTVDGVISERVQRGGDPNFSAPMPSLLQFDPAACTVRSTMFINFVPATNAANRLPQEEFNALKRRILSIGNERLNGWITIRVGSGDACPANCRGRNIRVEIVASEGAGQFSSRVELGRRPRRPDGREDAGSMSAGSTEWTIWHEMGHIVLGAADEYAEAGRPAERVNQSDDSIMASSHAYGRFGMLHPRHFSHIPAWLMRRFPGCTFEAIATDRPVIIDFNFPFTVGGMGGGTSGMLISTGLDMGIPLDRLRQFAFTVGPRLTYIGSTTDSYELNHALLLGLRTGIRYRTMGPIRFEGSLFGEAGGVGFTDLTTGEFGTAPYAEGGAFLGANIYGFQVGLEGAAGGRTATLFPEIPGDPVRTEFREYFRIGLGFGFNY